MKQLGHLVTKQNIRKVINEKKVTAVSIDDLLDVKKGTTTAYLVSKRGLSGITMKKYFALLGVDVDIVEVTPAAIICE